MRKLSCLTLVMVLMLAGRLSAQAPAPASLPTVEDLKQKLKDGKTPEVLAGVAKLLALKGDAAKANDRYELFCLRGEAFLRNKAMPAAADSFVAAMKETTDPQKQSTARATELLIRHSKAVGYTPKPAPRLPGAAATKPAGPLPIIEEEDRKVAMQALFADEMAAIAPRLKAATAANSLAPVIEVVKTLSDLTAIETAATGSSDQTKKIASDLGAHAHTLIKAALENMQQRTEKDWDSASRQNVATDPTNNLRVATYGMHGLTSVESNDLKDVIATCEKIMPVATQLGDVTASDDLKSDAPAAQKVHDRAKEVLNYDYNNNGRYNQQPPRQPGAGNTR